MARPKVATAAERSRQVQALELKKAGLTDAAIAEQLGYADKSGAWRAWRAVLDRQEATGALELRELHGARYERLLQAVWAAAMEGDVAAVREARKLIDSMARLYGTNKLDELAARQAELDEMQALAVVGVMRAFAQALGQDPDDPEVRSLIHRQILAVAGTDPTKVVDGEVAGDA